MRLASPGGHAENGESIYDSAVREIKEETGLTIQNFKSCGLIYWFNNKTEDRYFVHLYRTTDYIGELIEVTEEGRVFWLSLDDLVKRKLAPNFKEYLTIILENKNSEAYCSWNDDMLVNLIEDNPWGIIYR